MERCSADQTIGRDRFSSDDALHDGTGRRSTKEFSSMIRRSNADEDNEKEKSRDEIWFSTDQIGREN